MIGNDLRERPRVTAAIDALVARHHIPPDVAIDINIAIDEILANVINHAYRDDAAHRIHVQLAVVDSAFEAEVRDDGIPFDPMSVPMPDVDAPLAEREIGGLGILLVRNLMSGVSYRREGGRNLLKIVRRFP